MDALANTSETDFQPRIATVRRSVADFCKSYAAMDSTARPAILDRSEQHLKLLETWLLDAEQQQMLALNPLNRFFLHVCAYLLEMDWRDQDKKDELLHSSNEEYSKSGVSNPSLTAIVQKHWAQLGLADITEAREIAAICRESAGGLQNTADDAHTEALPTVKASVNRTLLAAGLHLARVLDLNSASVRREIHDLLAPGTALSMEALKQSLDVLATGPHRFHPGTIRVKIRCRHAELHRALKRYETRVQAILTDLNRRVTPR
ncbi:MAG: hypothetical protein PVG19_11020, partial [Desulfobacterales bacterium]